MEWYDYPEKSSPALNWLVEIAFQGFYKFPGEHAPRPPKQRAPLVSSLATATPIRTPILSYSFIQYPHVLLVITINSTRSTHG